MSIEYYHGGIEVELTSHDGPIVSRTMPQDYEYRGTRASTSEEQRRNERMHQPRRSFDASMTTAIPVKRLMSFGGVDSKSMVGEDDAKEETTSRVGQVWDAPRASGIEKENEAARFLRSYEPDHSPPNVNPRVLGLRDDRRVQNSSLYSRSEFEDEEASDISSSAMASSRRRSRISKIHAEKLLSRQQEQRLKPKTKLPFKNKTSINEENTAKNSKPTLTKNVSFGSKLNKVSPENSLRKVAPSYEPQIANKEEALDQTSKTMAEEGQSQEDTFEDPSNSGVIPAAANPPSPGRSVSTNLTYSTGGSGRNYKTRITSSRKYKGRVIHDVVTLNPDDLHFGRTLEGFENGFVDKELLVRAIIDGLFEHDLKQQPLHKVKQWEITESTVSRVVESGEQLGNDGGKEVDGTSDTTMATTVSEESAHGESVGLRNPPTTKRLTFGTKDASLTRELGTTRYAVEKTGSMQYKDVYGMVSATGIIHFYENSDEIWIEDYNFCFASRRFKFLSG